MNLDCVIFYISLILKRKMTYYSRDSHTAAKADVLNNELESCKMLLEEESENKCTLLVATAVIFILQLLVL